MAFTIDELPLQLSQYCVGQNIYRVVEKDSYSDTYIRDISIAKSISDNYTVEFYNPWDGNSQAKRFYSDSGKELIGQYDGGTVVTSYTTNNSDVSHLARDVRKGSEELIGAGNAQVYLFSTEDSNGRRASAIFNNPSGWIGRVIYACTSDYKHRKAFAYANPIGNDYYFLTIPNECTLQMEEGLESIQISPYLNVYKLPEATDTKYYWEGTVTTNNGASSEHVVFKRDRMVWLDKEISISAGTPAQAKYGTSVFNTGEDLVFKVEESTFPFDLNLQIDYPFDVSGTFKYGRVTSVRIEATKEVSKKCTAKIKAYYRDGSPVDGYLLVTQLPDLYFEVTPSSIYAPKEGELYTLTVKTNMQYRMEAFDYTTDYGSTWYTIKRSAANSVMEEIYDVKVEANPSARRYNGYIMFYPTGKSPVRVPVGVDAADYILRYDPISDDVGKEATQLTVFRYHNMPNIVEDENLVGITYTKEVLSPYPNGVTKYTINVQENTSSSDRASYLQTSANPPNNQDVSIEIRPLEPIVVRYNLVQRSGIVFKLVSEGTNNPVGFIGCVSDGNRVTVELLYNVGWQISNLNEFPEWLTINSISQDLNEAGITSTKRIPQIYTISQNTGDYREFTVIYTSRRGGTLALRIGQNSGIIPDIKVTPTYKECEINQSTFDLVVTATHNWYIAVIPDWIELPITSGVAGETTITITVKANALLERVADLVFHLRDYNNSAACRVVQAGLESGYDITDIEGDSDWGPRQETRIRDRYVKVKIRYTGNDKAIITAVKTSYTISHA